ncbi:MAG: 23S rRNA (adenine(2503)-C(2))-methyltransferase RlmN [Anaerolineales bacterium]
MAVDKVDLLDLSYDELQDLVDAWGEPEFRAQQIWHWVYHMLTDDPRDMTTLPKELRQRLVEKAHIGRLEVVDTIVSEDGLTEKVVFRAVDDCLFETVLMRYTDRNTVCVSSQVGCIVGCLFCATGQVGLERDLSMAEITAQVLYFARRLRKQGAHLTNVVFMGMGEPMFNFGAVWKAILNLHHPEGLFLGARRFTVSTAGVVPGIECMAQKALPVGLAISLHAPDDALRDRLVPLNRRYPLGRLLQACRRYIKCVGRRVTFEYVLAAGLNDSDTRALQTAELLRGFLCHVNLIPLNPTPGCDYEAPSPERVLRFQEILVDGGIQTTVRLGRGIDIQAGCGQLRGKYQRMKG